MQSHLPRFQILLFKWFQSTHLPKTLVIRPRRLFPKIQLLCHYSHWKVFLFNSRKGKNAHTHTHSQVYTNTQQSCACVCVCVWARVANNADENRLHSSDYKKISDWISVFISNVNSNKQEMCPECISKMSSVWVKIDKFNWNQFNNVIH